MKYLEMIACILLIIGGLNCGLVGLFDFNLVGFIFGASIIAKVIYIVVGLSAVYKIFTMSQTT